MIKAVCDFYKKKCAHKIYISKRSIIHLIRSNYIS